MLELAINENKASLTEQPPGGLSTDSGDPSEARTDTASHGREDNPPNEYSLKQLYQDGRHVCPMAFGEERTEGCLFCAAMLVRGEA